MGFFGSWVHDGVGWREYESTSQLGPGRPWLWIDIHDSDVTTVTFHPAPPPARGVAYVGYTPHRYFGDDRIITPGDAAAEAHALADWWAARHGGADAGRRAKAAEILPLLAHDAQPEQTGLVEGRTVRLLAALGLPAPDELELG